MHIDNGLNALARALTHPLSDRFLCRPLQGSQSNVRLIKARFFLTGRHLYPHAITYKQPPSITFNEIPPHRSLRVPDFTITISFHRLFHPLHLVPELSSSFLNNKVTTQALMVEVIIQPPVPGLRT